MKGGNWKNPYLSARPKDNNVVLYDKDDGSLRQRWLITSNGASIKVEGGTNTDGYLAPIGSPGSYIPKLVNNSLPLGIHMEEGTIESTFYIYFQNATPSGFYKEYLYSKDAVNQDLAFAEESKTGGRYVWEIVPVENFTLKDITYFMDYGDRVDSSLVFLRDYDLDNRYNPSPGTHTAKISESYLSRSQFSEVTGLNMSDKISNSSTYKVGTPSIDASGSVSFDHLTERTWSYSITEAEEKTFSWSDEFSTVVPAEKLMKLKVYVQKYIFDISYIGTLVGNVTGRTIKLKGRWEGSFGTKFVYRPVVVNGISMDEIEKNVEIVNVLKE